MSFLKNIFGKNKTEESDLLNKMIWSSEKNCWCAALWLSVKVLKINPDSISGRDIFRKAFANSYVGVVSITVKNKERMESITNLLQKRNMSLEEAKSVTDTMISVFYIQFLTEKTNPLLQRINNGKIRRDCRIENSDLDIAIDLSNALWDQILPDQKSQIKWKSIIGSQSASMISQNITSFKNALITLLRTNSSSDWRKTCKQIQEHLNFDGEMVNAFGNLANENYNDSEFRKIRDKFEITFSKEIAQIMQLQNLREPVIDFEKP